MNWYSWYSYGGRARVQLMRHARLTEATKLAAYGLATFMLIATVSYIVTHPYSFIASFGGGAMACFACCIGAYLEELRSQIDLTLHVMTLTDVDEFPDMGRRVEMREAINFAIKVGVQRALVDCPEDDLDAQM